MKKRTVAACALAAVLSFALLAGCGTGTNNLSGEETKSSVTELSALEGYTVTGIDRLGVVSASRTDADTEYVLYSAERGGIMASSPTAFTQVAAGLYVSSAEQSDGTVYTVYGKDGQAQHGFIDACRETCNAIYDSIPELPFSNMWAAQQLSSRLPANSTIHIGVSNTRRCWNIFPLPESVESVCNVGCCGIDGCSSSLVGASLVHPERVYFGVFGDLTFFYDMNVIGNRHVGPNVRIMLVNNGCGAEFRLYSHYCRVFGEDASPYMAAAGHFGNKSRDLVRHYAEDLGYQYLSATNKDEFLAAVDTFTSSTVGDRPMLFEIFTRPEDESDALKLMSTIVTEATVAARRKMVNAVKSVAGEKGSDVLRKLFKK